MTHMLVYYILVLCVCVCFTVSLAEFGVHGLTGEPGVFSCHLRLVLGLQPPHTQLFVRALRIRMSTFLTEPPLGLRAVFPLPQDR